jgi:hypothetical protein
MTMPGRNFTAGIGYRYSINGQEKTPEIAPNTTTAMYWEYDSRIMRRWNVDPVVKEHESPYLCFSGNPIWFSDRNGDDPNGGGGKKGKTKGKSSSTTTSVKLPNYRFLGLPTFGREMEFPKIHAIDLEYSKTTLGKAHTLVLEVPGAGSMRFLVLQYESNTKEHIKNRDASKKANPNTIGKSKDNTAGHEVPYASTKQGGALAMRRITDATENSQHGTALMQFYKEFNLKDGDIFLVPLFDLEPKSQTKTATAPATATSPSTVPLSAPLPEQFIRPPFQYRQPLPSQSTSPPPQPKQKPAIDPWRFAPPILRYLDFFLSPVDWDGMNNHGMPEGPIS